MLYIYIEENIARANRLMEEEEEANKEAEKQKRLQKLQQQKLQK